MDGAARAIALCWLAHALRAVATRLSADACVGVALLSTATGRCRGRDARVLPTLLRALQVQGVASIDELDAPACSALDAVRGTGTGVVVVCIEMEEEEVQDRGDCDDSASAPYGRVPQLQSLIDEATSSVAAWVLVGFSTNDTTGLSLRVVVHSPTSALDPAHLETALQPLDELRDQCGLPLALEMLAKLPATPSDQTNTLRASSLLASPVASQLPFQLLVMLLRWSFFHPRVVTLLGKPFLRKLALIPQPRVRRAIAAVHAKHATLWTVLWPTTAPPLPVSPAPHTSHHFTLPVEAETGPDDTSTLLRPLQRLSQCALWDKQKQFYRDQGIHAWSHHLIPFGVSSSAYLAMQYARLAVDFLRHTVGDRKAPDSKSPSRKPNCFVWEAASGSCKFLHSFLLHFYALVALDKLEERLGIVPCVVASDLSEQVLQSREEMACFQQYVAEGKLDFAVFDTDVFLHSELDHENRRSLFLRHAGVKWRVAQERGPVFIIGNYFFDSLRTDVLVVTQHESRNGDRTTEIREARIDATTDNIPDMLFSLKILENHPHDLALYAQPTANRTLVAVIDQLEEQWSAQPTPPSSSPFWSTDADAHSRVVNSSLILFPAEAIEFLDAVLRPQGELSDSAFPVAVVTGDATFSFRDAVPRSFVDEDNGDLEIPQLSPHPDCFCLPVDLEILQLAVSSANQSGSADIVSTPSSDTFNVFFTQSLHVAESSRHSLSQRFHDVFDQFTPCDCDLLWGLMSVDDGVRHLSSPSQLSLLTQTAWDFDVFSAVQWGLLHSWKKRLEESTLTENDKPRGIRLDRERHRLVGAGRKSLQTLYVLDESTQHATTALTKLQVARWFYELRAFADAKQILDSLTFDHTGLQMASIYLSALVAYHQHDLWAALTYFRKGQRLEPKRLRLKKWVARTLIRLQEAKQPRGETPEA